MRHAAISCALVLAACGGAEAQPTPSRDVRGRPTVLRGRASYYSDVFTGRETANGERYDPTLLTAASRTLPFGTRLRCTRVDNGRSVEVRINDRGPFGRRRPRILDLSRAAAEQLDMIERGVVVVRCRVLEWGPPRRRRARR